jgi:hypothetical protein
MCVAIDMGVQIVAQVLFYPQACYLQLIKAVISLGVFY